MLLLCCCCKHKKFKREDSKEDDAIGVTVEDSDEDFEDEERLPPWIKYKTRGDSEMKTGNGCGAVEQYVLALEKLSYVEDSGQESRREGLERVGELERFEKCLDSAFSPEQINVENLEKGSVIVTCCIVIPTDLPESQNSEICERVEERMGLMEVMQFPICGLEIESCDTLRSEQTINEYRYKVKLDGNFRDAESRREEFTQKFSKDLAELIVMDLYSLVCGCKVRGEQLALHRALGTDAFSRADMEAAQNQYRLALQLAPDSIQLQKLRQVWCKTQFVLHIIPTRDGSELLFHVVAVGLSILVTWRRKEN
eukprot:SAG31_NODE_111_length_24443_cov_231.743685_2_plen_311_part_00